MSEVFSILLHNRQRYDQGKEGLWFSLPTTTEKLQEALREIGISADNPQDFFLYDYRSPQERPIKLPRDLVLSADVDELNFLAARLEKLDAAELTELNAALTSPQSDFHSIGQIIDYPDNVDYYVHLPDVTGTGQLGDYYLNRSGMVDMPEEWKAGIFLPRFGLHIANTEHGVFTDYGYLVKSGDEWQRVHEGQPVPEEYRVMAYPAPEADRDAFRTEQPAPAAVLPEAAPIITKDKSKDEYMKEITDRLEAGVRGIMSSDNYKSYLASMSKFHSYSFRNTMLIFMQKPDASLVAGLGKWKSEFERTRKQGEIGLKILAPAYYKVKKRVPKIDPDTGEPIKDKDGKTVMEEQTITVPDYRAVSVYDVSQTEGKELPTTHVDVLDGDVEHFQNLQAALCSTHSIRRVVLEEIVLRNLREAIQYVTQYEDDFVQRAADQSLRERDKELAQKKDTLAQSQKRIAELDVIIKRLYEDNISGKLSDERFIKLSHDYEQEQANLKTMVENLRQDVKQQEKQKINVKHFIAAVKKYTDMTQLDASILREFVEKIYISDVYTPDENEPRIKVRDIQIVYNFIGAFDFEEAREQFQAAQKIAKAGVA